MVDLSMCGSALNTCTHTLCGSRAVTVDVLIELQDELSTRVCAQHTHSMHTKPARCVCPSQAATADALIELQVELSTRLCAPHLAHPHQAHPHYGHPTRVCVSQAATVDALIELSTYPVKTKAGQQGEEAQAGAGSQQAVSAREVGVACLPFTRNPCHYKSGQHQRPCSCKDSDEG
eukprot:scaffold19372_cov19-Tisochrysis_lutea.AAC.1